MSQTAEVVVVGGGAIGSSVAYYLSREGTKVLVLEKEAVGSGATAHATGSLSLMGTEFYPGPHFQLALESYRMYTELVPRLEEETGIEINYQRKPALRLALDEDEEWLIQEQVAWKKDFVSLKTIDGDEARRLEPRLNPRVRSGVYQEECARVDSYRLNLALVQAAESHGAQVQLRQVTGLETQNSRVTGVRTTDGTISCGTVVLTMGAWSAECGRWLNFPVPVRPLKGEKLLLKYDGAPLPFFLGSPRRGHMLTLPDGLLSVGSTGGRDYDPQELYVGVEYDRRTTEEAKMQLLHRAIDLIPEVEGGPAGPAAGGLAAPERRPDAHHRAHPPVGWGAGGHRACDQGDPLGARHWQGDSRLRSTGCSRVPSGHGYVPARPLRRPRGPRLSDYTMTFA